MPATNRLDAGRRVAADRMPPRAPALHREEQRRLATLPRFDRYTSEAAGAPTLQAPRRRDTEDAPRPAAWLAREPVPAAATSGGSASSRRREDEEVRHA